MLSPVPKETPCHALLEGSLQLKELRHLSMLYSCIDIGTATLQYVKRREI